MLHTQGSTMTKRIKGAARRVYTYLAARLVRAIAVWCTARGRYVDYVHREAPRPLWTGPAAAIANEPSDRLYMRRYVLTGYRTGDPPQSGWRAWLPNLYLHHMHAPDADDSLHDHPWPWGLSFVLLGGYREERLSASPDHQLERVLTRAWDETRTHRAPALNFISGSTFHRVAELDQVPLEQQSGTGTADDPAVPAGPWGTFTLFLAGPRRRNKPWGYLVAGRGYVDQKTRHAELGAREVRP